MYITVAYEIVVLIGFNSTSANVVAVRHATALFCLLQVGISNMYHPLRNLIYVASLMFAILLLLGMITAPLRGRRANLKKLLVIRDAVIEHIRDTGHSPYIHRDLQNNRMNLNGWNGPYVETKNRSDYWGGEFHYFKRDNKLFACSFGADNQEGGRGRDTDICIEINYD